MFFSNPQAEEKQLLESVGNMQAGMQNWFSGTPVGQTVNNWQNTAQQYQQGMNDWFNQTPAGQSVNQVNTVYDQRLQQLQQDEQTKNAAQLTSMYDSVMKQLGL